MAHYFENAIVCRFWQSQASNTTDSDQVTHFFLKICPGGIQKARGNLKVRTTSVQGTGIVVSNHSSWYVDINIL